MRTIINKLKEAYVQPDLNDELSNIVYKFTEAAHTLISHHQEYQNTLRHGTEFYRERFNQLNDEMYQLSALVDSINDKLLK